MKNNSIKLGIVVAQPDQGLAELKRFIPSKEAEFLLFPEAFLHSDDLEEACQIVKSHKKWLVCGIDDRRNQKQKFETAIVINPAGKIVGEHKKTSITKSEVDNGYSRGDNVDVIETDFGKIGIAICYEIHFPEISRIYALKGAKIVFNPIGTGMWHEKQYRQWTNIASARASENEIFVFGCSHFNDAIPLAFGYDSWGDSLVNSREENRLIVLNIPINDEEKKKFSQRRPELYGELTKKQRRL